MYGERMRVIASEFVEHGKRAKVYVDGIDVSNRCQAADDVEGWADCLKLNEKEEFYFTDKDRKELARERLYGEIKIEPYLEWESVLSNA